MQKRKARTSHATPRAIDESVTACSRSPNAHVSAAPPAAAIQTGASKYESTGYAANIAMTIHETIVGVVPIGESGPPSEPRAGIESSSSLRNAQRIMTYDTIDPAIATGSMRAAYTLKPRPACSATTRFIG